MNPADDIWAKVIELMKQQGLSPTTIKTWFDDAKAVSLTEDSFTISTPNDYTQSVIKSLYIPKIEAALKELFSMDLKVVVLTEKELENTSAAKQDILFPGTSDYTFERFVVGSSNRYAYSAARYSGPGGLQPAVYLRRIRTGQDPSTLRHRPHHPRQPSRL